MSYLRTKIQTRITWALSPQAIQFLENCGGQLYDAVPVLNGCDLLLSQDCVSQESGHLQVDV